MDNSPSWDQPLSTVPEATHVHIERRGRRHRGGQANDPPPASTASTSASSKRCAPPGGTPSASRRTARSRWRTRPSRPSPPGPPPIWPASPPRPGRTPASRRRLAERRPGRTRRPLGRRARLVPPLRHATAGPDRPGYFHRPGRLLRRRRRGPAAAPHDGSRSTAGAETLPAGIPTTDPEDPAFDPIRYWRGPVWVLVNWLVADGLSRTGHPADRRTGRGPEAHDPSPGRAGLLRVLRPPQLGTGIGGQGFSWSAALTLAWLTA